MSVEDRVLIAENRKKHEAACKEIRKHLPAFLIVGEQLLIIREAGIYLESHKSIEAFVKDEFGLERKRAYEYMESAKIKANLCSNGTQPLPILPTNERQFREVGKAPPELQSAVVEKVAEKVKSENRKPTANDFKKAVAELEYDDVELSDDDDDGEVLDMQARPETPIETPDHPKDLHGPIAAQVKAVNAVLTQVRSLQKQVGGEWLDVDGIERQVVLIRKSLRNAMYWADCPHCEKKGCNRCLKTGYFPEDRKKFLTPDESAVML